MAKEKKTELLQGTLELLVLRLLKSGPLNGWDIMQRIGLVSGEVIKVNADRSIRRCTGWRRGGW